MALPFNVLPNSDAARAIEAVRALELSRDTLDEQLEPILRGYKVDSVTRAAVGESARRVTATNPDIALQPLAESLVGSAVADPRVAGNNARETVKGGSKLSRSEQEALAIKAAGDEAERAGASRESAEGKARVALSKGASPEMAAQSAAAAAASQAVASHSNGSTFEIFGHLKALVQGVVIETIEGNESYEVTGNTTWKIDNALIQTTADTLEVNCTNYHAEAGHDVSRSTYVANMYLLGYYMTSPNPWTITGLSAAFTATTNAAYVNIFSPGVVKTAKIKRDLYASGLTVGEARDTVKQVKKMSHRGVIKIKQKSKMMILGGAITAMLVFTATKMKKPTPQRPIPRHWHPPRQ